MNRPTSLIVYRRTSKMPVTNAAKCDDNRDYRRFYEIERDQIERPVFTDIRFESVNLPPFTRDKQLSLYGFYGFYGHRFDDDSKRHPHRPHDHGNLPESFSWCEPPDELVDDPETRQKKALIQPVCDQGMCGSCWAVCIANVISDCLVVGGSVDWAPRISSTFLMMALPKQSDIQQMCNGGNPARVVKLLEKVPVVDESCIDYSWCSKDAEKLCYSSKSSDHFGAKITDKLNEKIPKKIGCYEEGNKFAYSIDEGSNIYHVDLANSVDEFRNVVRSHIVDFGPVIAGFVVLKNFGDGIHTDPSVNGGIYFDRAIYSKDRKTVAFSDLETTRYKGLHAVCIVGWGVARNVRYDTDKVGDVPYWHCRNSWGPNWGYQNGLFKIACYPFNKTAQLDKIVDLPNYARIGSIVMIRACNFPKVKRFKKLDELENHEREREIDYYKASPSEIDKRGFGKRNAVKSFLSKYGKSIAIATTITAMAIVIAAIVYKFQDRLF